MVTLELCIFYPIILDSTVSSDTYIGDKNVVEIAKREENECDQHPEGHPHSGGQK